MTRAWRVRIPRPQRTWQRLLTVSLAVAWLTSTSTVQAAKPAFPIRGVVYSQFGSVWSHTERMDMIGWMGAHGMNTFLYGPIEDVYTREWWRRPFPDQAMAEFAEEIALARSVGVRWGIILRPGTPLFSDTLTPDREICFSCEEDFDALAAKYEDFHDLGVRVLVLSFDDGVKASTHAQDAARFGAGDAAYGRMNADLANRLQQLFPDSTVILTPIDYSGTSRTEYLGGVAEELSPKVLVFWTGPQVASRTITAADADARAEAVSPRDGARRRPLIWDNYPVNDIYGEAFSVGSEFRPAAPDGLERAPSLRLHFGPLKGRGADLVGRVEGLLSNPMNQPHASKVALYTVAAYLNDPTAYAAEPVSCPSNPSERTRAGCLSEKAWLKGIRELGGASADHLLDVVSQMRSSVVDHTEAPRFVARRDALVEAFATADWEPAFAALVKELAAERDGGRAVRASNVPSGEFVAETANHLDTLERNTAAGMLAARMLKPQRPSLEAVSVERAGLGVAVSGRALRADPAAVASAQAELAPAEARMRASPFVVHGDRANVLELTLWGGSEYLLENRMDQFLDWAHETTAAWLPLSTLAATGPLEVTVNGLPVTVAADGTFSAEITLAPGQKTVDLVVIDAAGFRTARSYPAGDAARR